MNVLELKTIIANLPDNMDVFLNVDSDEFTHVPLNCAYVGEIDFFESPGDKKTVAKETVLVLGDDD